jgi:hypothetical protein
MRRATWPLAAGVLLLLASCGSPPPTTTSTTTEETTVAPIPQPMAPGTVTTQETHSQTVNQ